MWGVDELIAHMQSNNVVENDAPRASLAHAFPADVMRQEPLHASRGYYLYDDELVSRMYEMARKNAEKIRSYNDKAACPLRVGMRH